MKIDKVAKMKPIDRFLYWMRERHKVYLKRQAGKPAPWTDDQILQTVFFTNPYRENDKVTVWFRENIRDPLRNKDEVLFATVAFRWFNKPDPTGVILSTNYGWFPGSKNASTKALKYSLCCHWDERRAVRAITKANEGFKVPVFTGAYMIKAGSGPRGSKIGAICAAITNVWKERERLVQVAKKEQSLKALWMELKQFPFLGGFMSYEIVCDLRYTKLLENATDVDTWANAGPGAVRGMNRLNSRVSHSELNRRMPSDEWDSAMLELLKTAKRRLRSMPKLEMREIEHSLCEWDKYERVLFPGTGGRIKRRYNAT